MGDKGANGPPQPRQLQFSSGEYFENSSLGLLTINKPAGKEAEKSVPANKKIQAILHDETENSSVHRNRFAFSSTAAVLLTSCLMLLK